MYSSLILGVYYDAVRAFLLQIVNFVSIDLLFAITALVLVAMFIYFIIALILSYEASADRSLNKLNRYFYKHPVMNAENISSLNSILNHAPKTFTSKWTEFLEKREALPSEYISASACMDLPIKFNRTKFYTKYMMNFTAFSAIVLFLAGMAIYSASTDSFISILFSIALAPIMIYFVGGLLSAIVHFKGTETFKNLLGDFTMFQRNIDLSANGISEIDDATIDRLITQNKENKKCGKSRISTSTFTPKNSSKAVSSKATGVAPNEDFLNKIRQTPQSGNMPNGVPPANFNLGGANSVNAARTYEPNNFDLYEQRTEMPKQTTQSAELIKQYAEEKERIMREIEKIKQETQSIKNKNEAIKAEIDTAPVAEPAPAPEVTFAESAPVVDNDGDDDLLKAFTTAMDETDEPLPEFSEEEAPLSEPKKRGRKPKIQPQVSEEAQAQIGSALDQLDSAMQSLKDKK